MEILATSKFLKSSNSFQPVAIAREKFSMESSFATGISVVIRLALRMLPAVLVVGLSACGGSSTADTATSKTPVTLSIVKPSEEPVVHRSARFDAKYTGVVSRIVWQVDSAPEGSTAVPEYLAAISNYFTPDIAGTYTIKATAYIAGSDPVSATTTFSAVHTVPVLHYYAMTPSDPIVVEPVGLHGEADSPDSDPVSYHWALTKMPDGSSATITNPDAQDATFVADLIGAYTIVLIAIDGTVASEPTAFNFFAMQNLLPVLYTSGYGAYFDLDPVTIDASQSYDPELRDLAFAWRMIEQPAGSTVTLNVDNGKASFTPDIKGTYKVGLSINDGGRSLEKTFEIASVTKFKVLNTDVVDAEYDSINDRIVVVTADSQLITIDASTGTTASVNLSYSPENVAVTPDGTTAIVGHDGNISVIDLGSMSISHEYAISTNAIDIVAPGNGYAYVMPNSAYYNMHIVDLSDGSETLSSGGVDSLAKSRLQPSSNYLYETNDFDVIAKYELASADASFSYKNLSDFRTHPSCGNLWFNENGSELITGCGLVLETSAVQADDMNFLDELDDPDLDPSLKMNSYEIYPRRIISAHVTSASGTIATVDRVLQAFYAAHKYRYMVRTYDDSTFSLTHDYGLPYYPDGAAMRDIVPQFVFHQASTGNLLVIGDIQGAGTDQAVIIKY